MLKIYSEILPIFLLIFSGTLLRLFKIADKNDASGILKVVFYISLPALILANIPNKDLNSDFLYLPAIPFIIGAILFLISSFIGRRLQLERKTQGVFVISSLIINTAFAFPFVMALYGEEGLARILILDVGNAIVIYGFAYYQACKYGNHQVNKKQVFKRIAYSVPLWAIIIALVLNATQVQTNGLFYGYLKMAGDLTIPLLLISVGIYFEPKLVKIKVMAYAIAIRMGLGMLAGFTLANLFGFEGVSKAVCILATATPVGYNTLTFSSIEKLDNEFAAAIVSVSILIALFYLPMIIFIML